MVYNTVEMHTPDQSIDQADGARWDVYYDKEAIDGFTILTSAGRELLQGQEGEELRNLIRRYRAAEIGGVAILGDDPEVRHELGRGQEAIVYRMGPYAVREVMGIPNYYNALGELQRMDAINNVIEHGLPRWLKLPSHYAMHVDPRKQKTYTLMDRIDGGVTAEDVFAYPDLSEFKLSAVQGELEDHIGDAQEKIPLLYDAAYDALAASIKVGGHNPDNYLTDWKPRNVLIEALATPVAGSHYGLSVIDQYRA